MYASISMEIGGLPSRPPTTILQVEGHMRIGMVGRLATFAATLVLASPAPPAQPAEPTCPPGSEVGVGDFIVWVDDPSGGTAEPPVTAAHPCAAARMIIFETYDITARAGVDYIAVKDGTVVLAADATNVTIRVQVLGRNGQSPDVTFGVRLLSGAKFADPDGAVTITTP